MWHEVKAGKPTICIECGQVFQLKTNAAPEVDALQEAGIRSNETILNVGNIAHETNDDADFWEAFKKFSSTAANQQKKE